MSQTGWEGLGSLVLLARLSLRGRVRHLWRSLRQPKRLALVIVGFGLVALFMFAQTQGGGNPIFAGDQSAFVLPVFLSFFFASTTISAMANGTLVFTPPEVQFLFPAPIGTRALLLSRIASSSFKSASAAVIFTLFLRPAGVPAWRTLLGYLLVFETLVLLSIAVDLVYLGAPCKIRRRHAMGWTLTLLVAVGCSLLIARQMAGAWSTDVFGTVGFLARPWAGVLTAIEPAADLAICFGVLIVLLWRILGFARPIREQAGATSEFMQEKLKRMSKGFVIPDRPRRETSGKLLPLLPHWGGAGPHIWRQLSVLRRKGLAYGMLIAFTVLIGGVITFVGPGFRPSAGAGAMLGMLLITGPMYVTCDFRSDYDNLAWLRSLPSSSTALAAGQILASALVLYGLQLLLTAWIVVVAPAEQRLWWVVALVLLPFLNILQLCVENGAYLLYPFRLDYTRGPPGAVEMARMYALMLAKLVALLLALTMAALPGLGVGWFLKSPEAGMAVSALALVLETCLMVTLVGRLFLRVDPSRDLGQ
jgi:hypothetical protein